MDNIKTDTGWKKIGISMAAGVVLFLLISLFFDFYHELNDDVLIRDIVSGSYTGTPQGHNIQMLYPVSLLLSLFYRLIPGGAWYELFELGCFVLCFGMIGCRLIQKTESVVKQLLILLCEMIVFLGIYLWELTMVQYTVVCACLAATAAFWLYTAPDCKGAGSFIKKNIPSILLVVLAFNIRTEMLLLMGPFFAAAGLIKWSEEPKWFSGDSLKKYLGIAALISAGLGISFLINLAAYQDTGWKSFNSFFDARTEVYDFTGIPSYEEHTEFYDSIGLKRQEYELLVNYNFGLDQEIDTDTLNKIADYAHSLETEKGLDIDRLLSACKNYVKRSIKIVPPAWHGENNDSPFVEDTGEDSPLNLLVMIAYVTLICMAVMAKDKSYFFKIPVLVIFRSVSWLYILYRGRLVNRIIHPLYFTELLILLGMLLYLAKKNERNRALQNAAKTAVILCVMASLLYLPGQCRIVQEKAVTRENVNYRIRAVNEYTQSHPQNYYYLDVYSTVSFTEKMFPGTGFSKKNQELAGGWACKSPLGTMKTLQYGFTDAGNALIDQENVFFIMEEESDTGWIREYYEAKNIPVEIKKADEISSQEEYGDSSAKKMYVYQIRKTE